MADRIILGIHGKAGAGKSLATRHLMDHWAFVRLKMADPLKDMLRAFGLSDAHTEGSLKELPTRMLCGKSPRQAMMTLGTEWGRHLIHPDLWTQAWLRRLSWDRYQLCDIVCDDVRFPNEADAIRSRGGKIIVIKRWPKGEVDPNHESERHDIVGDFEIENAGTKKRLFDKIDKIIEQLDYHEPIGMEARLDIHDRLNQMTAEAAMAEV